MFIKVAINKFIIFTIFIKVNIKIALDCIQQSIIIAGLSLNCSNELQSKFALHSIIVTDIGLYNSNCVMALNSADEFRAKVCME